MYAQTVYLLAFFLIILVVLVSRSSFYHNLCKYFLEVEIKESALLTFLSCKGVDIKRYYYTYNKVLTPYMGYFTCRLYVAKVNPLPRGDKDDIPVEYWPSFTYKEIMILGAIEHELPDYYIKQLRELPHNGEEAYLRAVCLLGRYKKEKLCECPVPGRIPRKPLRLDMRNPTKPQQPQKSPRIMYKRGNM